MRGSIVLVLFFAAIHSCLASCDCLNDGTFGSFCGKHHEGDKSDWCYVSDSDCDTSTFPSKLFSNRKWINCSLQTALPNARCESAELVTSKGLVYGTTRNAPALDFKQACKIDRGYLRGGNGNAKDVVKEYPRMWYQVLSTGGSIFVDLCNSFTGSSSSLIVELYSASESLCESLVCDNWSSFQCNEHRRRLVFETEPGQWYFVTISDPKQYDLDFAVEISGAVVYWNDEDESVALPILQEKNLCKEGYEMDPKAADCVNVDECATGTHNCHEKALCEDTVGSFTCTCPQYLADKNGDGTDCIAMDVWELLETARARSLRGELASPGYNTKLVAHRNEFNNAYHQALAESYEYQARQVAANAPSFESLPNVGYIGHGYHFYKGETRSITGADPGFRSTIVSHTFGSGRLTGDGTKSLPDNVDAVCQPGSSFNTEVRMFSSFDEYQEARGDEFSFTASASLELKTFGVKAEAHGGMNKETQSLKKRLKDKQTIMIEAEGKVLAYTARLRSTKNISLDPSFVKMVEMLPPCMWHQPFYNFVKKSCTDEEAMAYDELIESFGTHIIVGAEMGGRAFERQMANMNKIVESTQEIRNWGFNAGGSFEVNRPSVKVGIKGDYQQSSTSDISSTTQSQMETSHRVQWFMGGVASLGSVSQDGDMDSLKRWAVTVASNPIPIAMSFMAVTDLLTEENFPDDEFINSKRQFIIPKLVAMCLNSDGLDCSVFMDRVEGTEGAVRFGDVVTLDYIIPNTTAAYSNLNISLTAQSPETDLVGRIYESMNKQVKIRKMLGTVDALTNETLYHPVLLSAESETSCKCITDGLESLVIKVRVGGSFDDCFRVLGLFKTCVDMTRTVLSLLTFQLVHPLGNVVPLTLQNLLCSNTYNWNFELRPAPNFDFANLKIFDFKSHATDFSLSFTMPSIYPKSVRDALKLDPTGHLYEYKVIYREPGLVATYKSDDKTEIHNFRRDYTVSTWSMVNKECITTFPFYPEHLTNCEPFVLTSQTKLTNADECYHLAAQRRQTEGYAFYAPDDKELDSQCFVFKNLRSRNPNKKYQSRLECGLATPEDREMGLKEASPIWMAPTPMAEFTQFRLVSPVSLFTEAKRAIVYGDVVYLFGRGGVVVDSEVMSPDDVQYEVYQLKENYKAAAEQEKRKASAFRVLSSEQPIGTIVRSGDRILIEALSTGRETTYGLSAVSMLVPKKDSHDFPTFERWNTITTSEYSRGNTWAKQVSDYSMTEWATWDINVVPASLQSPTSAMLPAYMTAPEVKSIKTELVPVIGEKDLPDDPNTMKLTITFEQACELSRSSDYVEGKINKAVPLKLSDFFGIRGYVGDTLVPLSASTNSKSRCRNKSICKKDHNSVIWNEHTREFVLYVHFSAAVKDMTRIEFGSDTIINPVNGLKLKTEEFPVEFDVPFFTVSSVLELNPASLKGAVINDTYKWLPLVEYRWDISVYIQGAYPFVSDSEDELIANTGEDVLIVKSGKNKLECSLQAHKAPGDLGAFSFMSAATITCRNFALSQLTTLTFGGAWGFANAGSATDLLPLPQTNLQGPLCNTRGQEGDLINGDPKTLYEIGKASAGFKGSIVYNRACPPVRSAPRD